MSFVVKADKVYKADIVKINDILLYKQIADVILEDAKNKNLEVINNGRKIIINDSKLLNEVIDLYKEAISSDGGRNSVCKTGDKLVVCVKKDKRVVFVVMAKDEG